MVLLGVYLIFVMGKTSTFFLPFPEKFEKYLLFLLFVCSIGRCLFVAMGMTQEDSKKKYITFLGAFWLATVYLLVYRADKFVFLLYLGILTVGCIGMDYWKLLRLHIGLLAAFLIVTCIGGLGGAIENYVFMKDGSIRSTWGICYPTDLASYVFFGLILLWTVWKRLPNEVMLITSIVGMWFARYIAMSITSTLCCGLFSVVLLGCILYHRIPFVRNGLNKINSVFSWALVLSFPLLAILMFGLIFAYAKGLGFALVLNNLLSERLKLPLDMYHQCGLKAFGTPFEQVGAGFSTFTREGYNFVDSTYPLILIRYGWVLFLTLCVIWSNTVRKAIRCGDWRLALTMALIAVHSFSEHHFIEVNYNLLVVMPFAAFPSVYEQQKGKDSLTVDSSFRNVDIRKRRIIALAVLCLAVLSGLFVLPWALAWMRTAVDILGWYGGGTNGVKVAGVIGSIFAVIAVMLYCVYECIMFWQQNLRRFKACAFLLVLCSLVLAGGLYMCNRVIVHAENRYANMLAEDEDTLNKVLALAEGKVYANTVPELYRRHFPGMDSSIFYKDELARCYNVTAVMDRQYDSACFINSGFLFMPISENHAIYTNDVSVIRGLQEKGYHLTGYYNVEKSVDLAQVAKSNELSYSLSGDVRMEGPEHSLIHGPYLSLYGGVYSVWYDLALDDNAGTGESVDLTREEALGTFRVSAYYGEKILKEQKLFRSQFDENGKYSLEVKFNTGNYYGIEFLAFMEEGQEINIEGIRYARTPSYDVHSFYDRSRKKYRDEYYSLEGERIITDGGYASCEYGYNYDRTVNEIRYYDENDEPVLIKAGYAQVKRDLDAKNRIRREEYYGVDGERILLSQGYSANEREYDDEGNVIVQRYYDSDDAPVLTLWGYAEVHRIFDENGRIIREAYFGTDGKPLEMSQGYAVLEKEYDDTGNITVQRYCDAAGAPVMTTWNYAEVHREFNAKNLIVEESYYGTEGDLIALPSGQAEVRREYNDANQVICEAYFGLDGNPVNMLHGYAVNQREYDANGNAWVQRYCDASGKPVMTTWNYAEVHRVFDEKRRITEESYYDTEGNLIALPSGQAEFHREYNDANQVIREAYFGLDGKPVNMPQGYAVCEREYDAKGNACVQRYCDASGKPVMTTWNYAEVHRVFDDRRRVIEESYYDTEGSLIALPSGQAEVYREYNDEDQVIREAYFGLDGKPVNMPQGYAVNEREYDAEGNACVQRYCDASCKPIMTTWNYAEVHRVFDEKRRVIEESYYDTESNLMVLPAGYAEVHREYNEENQMIREAYFGADRKSVNMAQGYAVNEREYDADGNACVQRYCDVSGTPVITTWGYAEVHRVFDEKRRIIREKYYDTQGKQIQLSSGQGIEERSYDDAGRLIEQRFYNLTGSPIMLTGGYFSLRREYDENGQQVRIVYYDLEGREVEPKA